MKYQINTDVTVNGNKDGVIRDYDKELDMYEVRLMDGARFVGDVIVPESAITLTTLDICYWCQDKPATHRDLCSSCYRLSA
jgi:hypothetical protein